jgi:DNA-directed RNA polymerase specialized sigma24 family protein
VNMTGEEYGQAYVRGFDLTVRFLLSRGAWRDIADEAAQTAWAKGWERRDQLRNHSLVITWVNSIALNVYRSLVRREPFKPTQSVACEKTTAIDLAAIDVAQILGFCRPCDQSILRQQYVEGLTTCEMAESYGVTETAIRLRLLRARRDARSQVEQRTSRYHQPNHAVAAFAMR